MATFILLLLTADPVMAQVPACITEYTVDAIEVNSVIDGIQQHVYWTAEKRLVNANIDDTGRCYEKTVIVNCGWRRVDAPFDGIAQDGDGWCETFERNGKLVRVHATHLIYSRLDYDIDLAHRRWCRWMW